MRTPDQEASREIERVVAEALLRVATRMEKDQKLRMRCGEQYAHRPQTESAISSIISALRTSANSKKEG